MDLRVEYRAFLYLGDKMSRHRLAKIKGQIEREPAKSKVYLIGLSDSPHNQLEIYSARWLSQVCSFLDRPRVVGVADSKKEAFELLVKITQDCLRDTGGCRLKEYLEW